LKFLSKQTDQTIERKSKLEKGIRTLVREAKDGNKLALEELIRSLQDRIYNLSLRMLGHPEDAEDAVQEILIKVITHLSDFREESALSTWVYRIASNHLLSVRKRWAAKREFSFELFEEIIDREDTATKSVNPLDPEQNMLIQELRIGCMQGMLQCLKRDVRLAFVLGVTFEMSNDEGAYVLGITAVAYRKRLSRGRTQIIEFMKKNCGLVNPSNPCLCSRQMKGDIKRGLIDPEKLLFAAQHLAAHPKDDLADKLDELDEMERITHLFRNYPNYPAPHSFVDLMKDILNSSTKKVLATTA
jgi:RNA polymerase sigma factor (sigma-70 family)